MKSRVLTQLILKHRGGCDEGEPEVNGRRWYFFERLTFELSGLARLNARRPLESRVGHHVINVRY